MAYRDLMRSDVQNKELKAIKESERAGVGYMIERFKAQMEEMILMKRKRGRPRKNELRLK